MLDVFLTTGQRSGLFVKSNKSHWSVASSNIDCLRSCQISVSRRFNSSTLWIYLWLTRCCMTWQQYDVIMTWWSSIEQVTKRYHQNFLLCNNNEITTCIADLFNIFCEELYVLAFFKLVQLQTIGEVGNSIMYVWADNFCQQQWKNY